MRWLNDNSKVKIWEKSRRIGATYVQSYEDVRDCVKRTVPAVWFSSADESAAREYIDYCKQWATLYDIAAKDLGEQVLDKEKDIKAYVNLKPQDINIIDFSNYTGFYEFMLVEFENIKIQLTFKNDGETKSWNLLDRTEE